MVAHPKQARDSRFLIDYNITTEKHVDVGRARFLHGPCLLQCHNGDWLCAYQDGRDDPGHGSFIRQKRSTDGGETWLDEGNIHDETETGIGCRNPAFGQTPDGKILMVVQRVGLRDLGKVQGENITDSILLISEDQGKTYINKGRVDKNHEKGSQGCSTHLVYHNGKFFMPCFHPKGLVLYISKDEGETWPQRIMMASKQELKVTPTYPTLVVRPDGSFLLIAHLNLQVRCFGRISRDEGQTWGDIFMYDDLPLRHGVLQYSDPDTLLCVGRQMEWWKPAFCVSPDHGESWCEPIDLLPQRGMGGGYTAVWPLQTGNGVFIAASTDGESLAAQDIVALKLEQITITQK
ncbi:hypothetical protein GF373_07090 [bacterium]|nr:hypothetical protein [bacterium]